MDKARELERSLEQTISTTEQQILQGEIDTTDTKARYLGYLARLRPVLVSSSRYLAYSSDVGESFRPVVAPKVVTGAYALSWSYVLGDSVYEAHKARLRAKEMAPDAVGSVVGLTFAKRATFHAVGSMLLPSLTIHSIVKYSAVAIKKWGVQSVRLRQWIPSMLGLGFIPFLPPLFDEPVEGYVDSTFDRLERKLFPDANSPIRRTLEAGKHHTQQLHAQAEKEKTE